MKCNKRKLLLLILVLTGVMAFMYYLVDYTDTGAIQKDIVTSHTKTFNNQRMPEGNKSYDQMSHNNPLGQKFPRIFIIGFGKTGTRVLFNALLMHSKIIGPYKEVRFFDEHYQFGLPWYIFQMPQPKEGQQVAEKSPCYILDQKVPARLIKAAKLYNVVLEELKFVVMFRHPIVRAISEYLEWQSLRELRHSKMLAHFDDLALDQYGHVNTDFQPLNHSVYAYHLKQWLQNFNPNQFCFVNGELFHEQPYNAINKLEKCLDLPPEITKDNFVWEETRQLHCLSYKNGAVICPGLSKGRPHPFVQQEVVDALMTYFKPYNEELYAIIGENYNWENDYIGLNIL